MAPEKSNFVQTCNLLSQYIKEKGSFKDLNLEIGGKIESLEAIVNPSSTHSATMNVLANMEKSKLFMNPSSNKARNSKDIATKNDQLTIFYGGRVLVFDDYPAEKAEEVVSFAKKGSSQMMYNYTNLSSTLQAKSNPGSTVASTSTLQPFPQELLSSQLSEANGSEFPIARRSSLRRFLGKRKNRGAATGPYQVQEQPAPTPKGDEQLELKL